MAKYTPSPLVNLQNETTAVTNVNNNYTAVSTAMENTLSRDGTTPNSMGADLDMNAHRILNLPDAISPTEPMSLSKLSATAVRFDIAQSLTPTQQLQARNNINSGSGGGGTGAVASVFGRNGIVTAQTGDYTVAQVTGAAPLADPPLTGVPTSTTAAALTNTTQIATTAFVQGEKASPTFTGTPLSTTAAIDTSTTQIATTAFVTNQAGAGSPVMDGAATTGTSKRYSREDHVHPSDTSRAPLASPTFTGTPAAPTATPGTNTTQLATTAFVAAATGGGVADGAVTAVKLATSSLGYQDGMINGTFAVSASAGALTIALKTLAGTDPTASDPVYVVFRNVTSTTGDFTVRTITAANSVVITSTATLGLLTSAIPFRIWIVGFDDAGTFRLGVVNSSTINSTGGSVFIRPVNEGINSSTILNASSNSAGVIYTGTAVASKSMRILGYVDWNATGLATTGTWTTTNLNSVQLFGPGIKKPGDVLQTAFFQSSTSTTSSSGTPAITVTIINFTPSQLPNPIEIVVVGSTTTANPTQAGIQISRGTGPTMIGGSASQGPYSNQGVGSIWSSVTVTAWDLPKSLSATSYNVYLNVTVPGNNVTWGGTGPCSILVKEYMG